MSPRRALKRKLNNVNTPQPPCAAKVMLLHPILAQISKHLPAHDLLKLRQTCKPWNSSFVPSIRDKHAAGKIEKLRLQNSRGQSNSAHSCMEDFTNLMRTSSNIPYSKFKIDDPSSIRRYQFREFLAVCGSWIRVLHLDPTMPTNNSPASNVRRIRQAVFQLAPNLTELALWVEDKEDGLKPSSAERVRSSLRCEVGEIPNLRVLKVKPFDKLHPLYFDLLCNILRNAVGMEMLSLQGDGGDDEEGTLGQADILTSVGEHMPNLANLKFLHLRDVTPNQLAILVSLGRRQQQAPLCLRGFHATFDTHLTEPLQAFLNTQSHTLAQLTLGAWTNRDSPIRIPFLGSLDRLRISRDDWFPFVEFDRETLESTCPALEEFGYTFDRQEHNLEEIGGSNDRLWVGELNTGRILHAGVSHLRLTLNIDIGRLATFATSFPSVTKLTFGLRWAAPEGLEASAFAVWAMWPALTTVRIEYWQDAYNSLCLDQLVSGIEESSFNLVRNELSAQRPLTTEILRRILVKHKTKPGISDLQHLRKFVLNVRDFRYTVTDIGGYMGFAMASPGVQMLAIETEKCSEYQRMRMRNEISEGCRTFIRSAIHPHAVLAI